MPLTYVGTRMNVWEALAGRSPDEPGGPADPGLWGAVVDRLDPVRARPVLRAGVEAVQLTSVRGVDYIMLRSPDGGVRSGYLRLTPEEWRLALLMDGSSTVARLVAEFTRIAGRLAPHQVRRVVADLAGNRMLDELPRDAFRPLEGTGPEPPPERVGNPVLAAARGRRMLVFDIDALITRLYRAGGRFLFGTGAFVVTGVLALIGMGLFTATWVSGSRSLFLTGDSYPVGVVLLVLLNGVVLGAYELSRALAVKATGREVSAAGVVLHFGIPSLFADTADAWLAGRRARLLVGAAGPAGTLLLAGVVQLAGSALPVLGGVAFKLAFLCYLNVFFRLSPLLPRDGQYLLMDWLEIPLLCARGLAWVGGRLRGRPPRFSDLDREGRLVGLSGVLCVAWSALAVALAHRIWTDRISGLATGLRPAGPLGGLLLVVVVLGLGAPAVFVLLGGLSRGWQRVRRRRAESDREADGPRRVGALRASDLGGLPEPALQSLAVRARWVHPPTGRQVVRAGESQPGVYVVVEGALRAREPGDPPGTIRHHVGPGGVVGLVNTLTGRATRLDWHTAGTSLLYIPSATVATVIGPLPGPPPQDRAAAEALLDDTPALAGLAVDQRLALIASAHRVDLDPGAPVVLPGPTHAVVVESGVIAMPDGVELRRGTLVGPVGDGVPGGVAQTRTPVRLWVLPDASDVPPLVGGPHRPGSAMPVVAVSAGPRPAPDAYPPLAVPPGPPDDSADAAVDHRFEGRLWLATLLVLIAVLVLTAISFRPGPAWAEMPTGQALLTVDRGGASTDAEAVGASLTAGDRRYVGAGTRIDVEAGSTARLIFPGGATAVLCGGSRLTVDRLATGQGRRQSPRGTVGLHVGRVLADTTSTSGAYRPLDLTVAGPQGAVVNTGAAWFAVDAAAVTVSIGEVSVGGTPAAGTGTALSCGDGVPVPPPTESDVPFPAESAPVSSSVSPSVSASPGPTATTTAPTGTSDATATDPTTEPTRGTTTRPPTTPPTTRPPTTTPTISPTTGTTTTPTATEPTTDPTSEPAVPSTIQGLGSP